MVAGAQFRLHRLSSEVSRPAGFGLVARKFGFTRRAHLATECSTWRHDCADSSVPLLIGCPVVRLWSGGQRIPQHDDLREGVTRHPTYRRLSAHCMRARFSAPAREVAAGASKRSCLAARKHHSLIDEAAPARDADREWRVGRANPSHGRERCAAALQVADWLQAATLTIAE